MIKFATSFASVDHLNHEVIERDTGEGGGQSIVIVSKGKQAKQSIDRSIARFRSI